MQGTHHVAHRSTRTTLPCCSSIETRCRCRRRCSRTRSGAGCSRARARLWLRLLARARDAEREHDEGRTKRCFMSSISTSPASCERTAPLATALLRSSCASSLAWALARSRSCRRGRRRCCVSDFRRREVVRSGLDELRRRAVAFARVSVAHLAVLFRRVRRRPRRWRVVFSTGLSSALASGGTSQTGVVLRERRACENEETYRDQSYEPLTMSSELLPDELKASLILSREARHVSATAAPSRQLQRGGAPLNLPDGNEREQLREDDIEEDERGENSAAGHCHLHQGRSIVLAPRPTSVGSGGVMPS